MEQVIFYLTEYSEWIKLGINALMLLLLASALHRMRKLKKQIRKTEGRIQEYLDRAFERMSVQDQSLAGSAVQINAGGMTGDDAALSAMYKEEEHMDMEAPENLIDAVLEEVFP